MKKRSRLNGANPKGVSKPRSKLEEKKPVKKRRVKYKGGDDEHMAKMRKAQKRSRKKAEVNGYAPTDHAIKRLMDIQETSPHATSRVRHDPDAEPKNPGNIPVFMRDKERTDKFMGLLSEGAPPRTACKFLGISYQTLKRWLELGQQGATPEYAEFQQKMSEAVAVFEMRQIRTLQAHTASEWRAAAWFLERRFPENWAKQDEKTINVGGEVVVSHKKALANKVTEDDESRELARKLIEGDEFGWRKEDADGETEPVGS